VTEAPRPAARYGRTLLPLAIAHRGGAGLGPENTIAAFTRAYDLGFRYLETDVRTTADGTLVAFHDARVERVTDGHGAVNRLTWDELRRLTVAGQPIPTLTELLLRFPDACFTVDVKDDRSVTPLVDALLSTHAASRVCIAGAWDGLLRTVADRVGPELTTALGWRDLSALVTCAHARIRAPRSVAGSFVHVPLRVGRLPVFGERLLARARHLGIGVIVWTVDDAAQMHRLLDAGVAGIITDRPDVLREVLVARDEWTPVHPEPRSVEITP